MVIWGHFPWFWAVFHEKSVKYRANTGQIQCKYRANTVLILFLYTLGNFSMGQNSDKWWFGAIFPDFGLYFMRNLWNTGQIQGKYMSKIFYFNPQVILLWVRTLLQSDWVHRKAGKCKKWQKNRCREIHFSGTSEIQNGNLRVPS